MSLYDYAWPSIYEEIKRFFPVWYWDVLEMDAIWRALGKELDGIRSAIESLIDNNYIATADETAIAELENFLGIVPESTSTLDERRQVLATYFRGNSHIGAPEIKEITAGFIADGTIAISFDKGTIHLRVVRPDTTPCNYLSCYVVLSNAIPAHLYLDMKVISLIRREMTMFTGIALRTSKTIQLEMDEVEIEAFVILTDELGNALLDWDDSIIIDGLEVET